MFFRRMIQIDLRALALCRIALGLAMLINLFIGLLHFHTFYSDAGFVERGCVLCTEWSLHNLSGSYLWTGGLFALQILAAMALTVGYKTSWATFISWLLSISLISRNPLILQSGDFMLVVTLFWAMFLPWGSHYSVDAKVSGRPQPTSVSNLASFAFLAQIGILYGLTGHLKTGAPWESDFTALYYVFMSGQYSSDLGAFLTQFPLFLKALTFLVVKVEVFFPVLLFLPWAWSRTFLVVFLLLLHSGILFTMNVGMFPLFSMAIALSLLPSRFFSEASSPLHLPMARWKTAVVSAALTLVLLSVVDAVHSSKLKKTLAPTVRVLGLRQPWVMFSRVDHHAWWYVIRAETTEGHVLNLFPREQEYSEERPERIHSLYKSQRWLKFMSNLWYRIYNENRRRLLTSLCEPRFKSLELLYLNQEILLDQKYGKAQTTPLLKIECPKP